LPGVWTGKVKPFTTSIKFNDNGTGLICSTRKGKNTLEKITYSDDVITTKRGTKIDIESISSGVLTLVDSRPIAKRYELSRSDKLSGVSWYCKSKLK